MSWEFFWDVWFWLIIFVVLLYVLWLGVNDVEKKSKQQNKETLENKIEAFKKGSIR